PETMGSGAAFFDYDGYGRPDLYLVNGAPLLGDRSRAPSGILYRNLDGRHFQDVTRAARLDAPLYGMGAAVGDFDNDGHPDLLVTGFDEDRLYHNRGDGTFEDGTQAVGLTNRGFISRAAFADDDRDGWSDLAIANDTVRNFLYVNNRDGTFSESGVVTGMAYSESGATRGGMGIDTADLDSDGYADIVIGNFAQEMDALYRGSEKGY